MQGMFFRKVKHGVSVRVCPEASCSCANCEFSLYNTEKMGIIMMPIFIFLPIILAKNIRYLSELFRYGLFL